MKICMQKVPILGQNFPKINKRGEHYSGLQSMLTIAIMKNSIGGAMKGIVATLANSHLTV